MAGNSGTTQQTFRAWNPGDAVPPEHPFARRHGLDGRRRRPPQLPPKFYILDMFPYPSGAGLHVGHPEGYTATDILARYRRALGFNVLHPMGWDAFGLPAEQYAIKTGQHPRQTTEENIATFKRQIKSLGFSYDWSRELDTTDPDYFKWTQWIFLKLYNSWFNPETNKAEPIETLPPTLPELQATRATRKAPPFAIQQTPRLRSEAPVWWCEQLGTVLANEEVDRRQERSRRLSRRAQADAPMDAAHHRLRRDACWTTWTQLTGAIRSRKCSATGLGAAKARKWTFTIGGHSTKSKFGCSPRGPTRLFGATYMVLSPEHKLVDEITTPRSKKLRSKHTKRSRHEQERPWNAPNWRRKKPASSPARMPSIRSTAKKFRSGSPTTCSPATAPAPSWLCRRTTSATSNSPRNSTLPIRLKSSQPRTRR